MQLAWAMQVPSVSREGSQHLAAAGAYYMPTVEGTPCEALVWEGWKTTQQARKHKSTAWQ